MGDIVTQDKLEQAFREAGLLPPLDPTPTPTLTPAPPNGEGSDFLGHLSGIGREILQGATFNFGDDIYAAGVDLLGGDGQKAYEQFNQARGAYSREAPWLSTIANVGGGMLIPAGGALGMAGKGVGTVLGKATPKMVQAATKALTQGTNIGAGAVAGAADAYLASLGEGQGGGEALPSVVIGGGLGGVGTGIAKALSYVGKNSALREMARLLEKDGYSPDEIARMVETARMANERGIPAAVVDITNRPDIAGLPADRSEVFQRAKNLSQVKRGTQAIASKLNMSRRDPTQERFLQHLGVIAPGAQDLTRADVGIIYDAARKAQEGAMNEALERSLYQKVYSEYPRVVPQGETAGINASKLMKSFEASRDETIRKAYQNAKIDAQLKGVPISEASETKEFWGTVVSNLRTADPNGKSKRVQSAIGKVLKEADPERLEAQKLVDYFTESPSPSIRSAYKLVADDVLTKGGDLDQEILSTKFWGRVRTQADRIADQLRESAKQSKRYDTRPDTMDAAVKYLDDALDVYTEGQHGQARKAFAREMESDPNLYGHGVLSRLAQAAEEARRGGVSTFGEIFGAQGIFPEDVDLLKNTIGEDLTKKAMALALRAQTPDAAKSLLRHSQLVGSNNTLRQLQRLLPPEQYDELMNRWGLESAIESNVSTLGGGSPTYSNAAADAATPDSILKKIASPVSALAHGAVNAVTDPIFGAHNNRMVDLLLNPSGVAEALERTGELIRSGNAQTGAAGRMSRRVLESIARTQDEDLPSGPTRIVIGLGGN